MMLLMLVVSEKLLCTLLGQGVPLELIQIVGGDYVHLLKRHLVTCVIPSLVARKFCSTFVDPIGLSPLLACCLIALNKNPGVRPIGITEMVRRIIAKAILSITRLDILEAAGPLQFRYVLDRLLG